MNLRIRAPRTPSECATYDLVVGSRLSARSAARFEGFAVGELPDGTTRIVGQVRDQPALFGLLNRIRDLNVPLLSLRRLDADTDTVNPKEETR